MSLIRTEVVDRVATITLCDPDHRNALRLEMADELAATVEQLESQDVGAMVITGEGPAFCAGADLDALARAEGIDLVRIYRSFTRIYQSNIPSVAAVNGPAVGAGFNLALCCDVRLASPSARFDTAFLRLNVHPGGGATWLLQRTVGMQSTHALVLFMETLDGPEAERVGLVWRCVPEDELLERGRELATRAAAHPPALMQKLRHTLHRMEAVEDHGHAVQLEMDEQLWSLAQPEAQAAIAEMQRQIAGD